MNCRLPFLFVGIAIGCANPPPPAIFGDMAAVRSRSGMTEIRRLAPQTVAEAERLTRVAEQAHAKGEPANAQFAAERALAAYARADIEARLARAEAGLEAAHTEHKRLETAEASLTRKQTEAARELSELDLRLGIERDLDVTVEIGRGSPEREAARAKAARLTATEARHLCASAHLLGVDTPRLTQNRTALEEFEESLAEKDSLAPLAQATQLRADCLAILGEARRPTLLAHPAQVGSDRLFLAISEADFNPRAEDRGIVVSLPLPHTKSGIDASTRDRLTVLARMARSHDAGLMLVSYAGAGTQPTASAVLLDQAKRLFSEEGVTPLEGDALALDRRWTAAETASTKRPTAFLDVVFVTHY